MTPEEEARLREAMDEMSQVTSKACSRIGEISEKAFAESMQAVDESMKAVGKAMRSLPTQTNKTTQTTQTSKTTVRVERKGLKAE